MTDKPNFKANDATSENSSKDASKKVVRKEIAAFWYKETASGEKYLSVKVVLPNGETMKFNAFKNNYKSENASKPDYIAHERKEVENA